MAGDPAVAVAERRGGVEHEAHDVDGRRTRRRSRCAVALTLRPSAVTGLCRPGVSTNTSWASGRLRMPRTRWRVVCGLSETMLTFCAADGVDERRLADVGPADQRDEPRLHELRTPAQTLAVRPAQNGARSSRLRILPRAGLGQLVEPRDRPRHLVAGEVLAGVRGDAGLVERRRPGAATTTAWTRLAPLLARDAEHGGLVDVGVRLERGLDLGRVDVHPAGDDHVLLAVADVEEALVVAVGDVADGLEAVAAGPPRTCRAACSSRRTPTGCARTARRSPRARCR